MNDFGKRLRRLLDLHGMNQSELAEKANLTTSAVSHYVRGSRIPRVDVMVRIAKALDVSMQELVGQPTSATECADLHDAVEKVMTNAAQLSDRERYDLIVALSDPANHPHS